ncbi:hypothetical protein [Francisella tularensis]|uniref:hypothetical protein n=1 Tax=Francisella tularensis TaxID=263 RepID=UPI0008F4F245|nr:hypothetical protein [Francisella tularensis]APA83257.1 hypothetical protein N894_1273 [Francisella tularensis subsp. novicida PA10-7858]
MKLEIRVVESKKFINATKLLTEEVFSYTRTYAQVNKLICGKFDKDKYFSEKLAANTNSFFVECDSLKIYLATSRLVSKDKKIHFMQLLSNVDTENVSDQKNDVEDDKQKNDQLLNELSDQLHDIEIEECDIKEEINSLFEKINQLTDKKNLLEIEKQKIINEIEKIEREKHQIIAI